MAGKITTNSVVLGDSLTDTQNFVLKTNADGTATLARGALGALGTVFGVNGSGALTGVSLVAPALGTPASGVLTNCTGVPSAALPAGSVLQVVNASYGSPVTNSTGSYIDSNLTASITPRSASSKILVLVSQTGLTTSTTSVGVNVQLLRGASAILIFGQALGYGGSNVTLSASCCYLDSPATTSVTTYKTQFVRYAATGTVYAQGSSDNSTITLMEIQG
jgi:hypothetical protein